MEGIAALYIFMLAAFTGYEVISRVPVILHTPLMSGSNFVHGVVLVGAMVGFGFLAKFTNALQGICVAIFLLLTREGRAALRAPGPWLGGALSLVLTAPFWIWNTRHGWVTIGHLADRGALDEPFRISLSEFWQFLTLQAVVF